MAESKVRDDNYFMVSGWMLNRLNLKGVPLQVFSIIYGFSQDGESCFTGSLQYLMDFTNASKPTIIKALKELVESGFILKIENEMNGVKFNKYRANLLVVKEFNRGSQETLLGGSKETLPGGSKETLPNNKDLDNKNNISKDIVNEIVSLYHSICVSFPTVKVISDSRKKNITAIMDKYGKDSIRTVFENAEGSSFLKGSDGGWKASFDWMMKDGNFIKILEGNYADRRRKEPIPGWMEHSLGAAEEETFKRMMNNPGLDEEELQRLEAEQEKELAARAERLKKLLRE